MALTSSNICCGKTVETALECSYFVSQRACGGPDALCCSSTRQPNSLVATKP
jgi:hypothetical protein